MSASQSTDEIREHAYREGRAALARELTSRLLGDLPKSHAGRTFSELALELDETRAMLRRVCEDYGDNDWPDDLYLPDVIEKHLLDALEDRRLIAWERGL